jgi:hypothetical protein
MNKELNSNKSNFRNIVFFIFYGKLIFIHLGGKKVPFKFAIETEINSILLNDYTIKGLFSLSDLQELGYTMYYFFFF